MRRTFEREQTLPPFACTLADLEALTQQVLETFRPHDPTVSIDIELTGEELEFNNFEEIKQFTQLPARLTKFSIYIFTTQEHQDRSFHLWAQDSNEATVTASGPNEAWCAGLKDVALGFAQRHRRWYAFTPRWFLGLAALSISTVPSVFKGRTLLSNWPTAISYFSGLLLLSLGWLGYGWIFPPATLLLRHEERWWRRYNAELSLIAAIVAAIAAVAAVFTAK
jgi:hypothetical protein